MGGGARLRGYVRLRSCAHPRPSIPVQLKKLGHKVDATTKGQLASLLQAQSWLQRAKEGDWLKGAVPVGGAHMRRRVGQGAQQGELARRAGPPLQRA